MYRASWISFRMMLDVSSLTLTAIMIIIHKVLHKTARTHAAKSYSLRTRLRIRPIGRDRCALGAPGSMILLDEHQFLSHRTTTKSKTRMDGTCNLITFDFGIARFYFQGRVVLACFCNCSPIKSQTSLHQQEYPPCWATSLSSRVSIYWFTFGFAKHWYRQSVLYRFLWGPWWEKPVPAKYRLCRKTVYLHSKKLSRSISQTAATKSKSEVLFHGKTKMKAKKVFLWSRSYNTFPDHVTPTKSSSKVHPMRQRRLKLEKVFSWPPSLFLRDTEHEEQPLYPMERRR